MIDPNTAPQIIPPVHPSWFDWITVAAIVVGPILALLTQRFLDWTRERRNRRVQLYFTVMQLRGTWLHPDSIRALNSIDTVFDRQGDKPIRDAWAALMRQLTNPRPQNDPDAEREWDEQVLDKRVDLYQVLGQKVGYDHTVNYIKNQVYTPQYHVNAELEQTQIRKQFAKAITDDGLKVVLTEPPPPRR